jgi:hypothetical protein
MFLCTSAKGNDIDKIRNVKDIVKFMSKNVDSDFDLENLYGSERIRKLKNIPKPKVRFYKLDFDNNGLTDLLVEGAFLFAIVDKGNSVYENLDLNVGKLNRVFCRVDEFTNVNGEVTLTVSYPDEKEQQRDEINSKYKFIYKFGGFIEQNLNVKPVNIDSIEYSINSFTCVRNSSLITKNQLVKTSNYDKCKLKETNTLVLESSIINRFFDLLKYMDFSNLENSYKVNWTDARTSYLTVYFNNGDVKKVMDYGSQGTHGLVLLYKLISDASIFEE